MLVFFNISGTAANRKYLKSRQHEEDLETVFTILNHLFIKHFYLIFRDGQKRSLFYTPISQCPIFLSVLISINKHQSPVTNRFAELVWTLRVGEERERRGVGEWVARSLIGCLASQQKDQSNCYANCEINCKVWPWRFSLDMEVRPVYRLKKKNSTIFP